MERILFTAENCKSFILEFEEVGDTYSEFKIYLVEPASTVVYPNPPVKIGDHILLLEGDFKWTGCTDIHFENSVHFCSGLQDWMLYLEVIKHTLQLAAISLEERRGNVDYESEWVSGSLSISTKLYTGEIKPYSP